MYKIKLSNNISNVYETLEGIDEEAIKLKFKKTYRKLDGKKIPNKTSGIIDCIVKDLQYSRVSNKYHTFIDDDLYRVVYDIVKDYTNRNPSCVICGSEAEWNPKTMKYSRLCISKKCKEKASDIHKDNMQSKYGVSTLLNDMTHQDKMLKNRSIAKEYLYSDGTLFTVIGGNELLVIEALDKIGIDSKDIKTPGPIITYIDPNDGGKEKQHLPDFYIESINLIISVKDFIENPNTHDGLKKNRLKNLHIYNSILKSEKYNYVQIDSESMLKDLKTIISRVKTANRHGIKYIIPPKIEFELLIRECANSGDYNITGKHMLNNVDLNIINISIEDRHTGETYDIENMMMFKEDNNGDSFIVNKIISDSMLQRLLRNPRTEIKTLDDPADILDKLGWMNFLND